MSVPPVLVPGFFLLFAAQIPMALYIHFDAKRRNIDPDRRKKYVASIFVVIVGYIPFFYYLENRETLPRADDETGGDSV